MMKSLNFSLSLSLSLSIHIGSYVCYLTLFLDYCLHENEKNVYVCACVCVHIKEKVKQCNN